MADDKKPEQDAEQRIISAFVKDLIERTSRARKESPRAYIIVMTAYIDDYLTDALKANMVVSRQNDDELFSSWSALYNFGPRIDLAYRMGIISADLTWVLHQIRKLRDDCAHKSDDVDLSKSPFKERIGGIYQRIISAIDKDVFDPTDQFERFVGTILIILDSLAHPGTSQMKNPKASEWIFKPQR